MAIMGFGGGALIASPLSNRLMALYDPGFVSTEPSAVASAGALAQTFVTLGVLYFIAMLLGAFGYRVPAPGYKPAGWTPSLTRKAMITK